MFSNRYEIIWEQISELSGTRAGPLDSLRPLVASDFAPFFWSEGFGLGGEPDQAIIARSAEVKPLFAAPTVVFCMLGSNANQEISKGARRKN